MNALVNPGRKALVLDFGGVISRTLFETHPQTEQALGLAPGTLTWQGPFDPATDALWRAMQAGEISERDYWHQRTREVGAMLGESWSDMQTLVKRARGADPRAVIRPEAVLAIHQAKAMGCALAILSNELDLFYGPEFRHQLDFMPLFDVVIDATYTGILKPDPRAYALCTDALNVQPSQCIFVDDQYRNIEGAVHAGWQTVHFDVHAPATSYDQALRKLAAF
jgi:putative hydrolase of the HAD superfamily